MGSKRAWLVLTRCVLVNSILESVTGSWSWRRIRGGEPGPDEAAESHNLDRAGARDPDPGEPGGDSEPRGRRPSPCGHDSRGFRAGHRPSACRAASRPGPGSAGSARLEGEVSPFAGSPAPAARRPDEEGTVGT